MSEERVAREVREMVDRFPGPRAGFRRRVLDGVPDDRERPAGRRWAAVAAAVLALILVATLLLGVRGLVHRPQPVHRRPAPSPSPTATVVGGVLHVADSTPVVPFVDPADPRQVDAVTWTGVGPGRLGLRLGAAYGVRLPSPDGTRFPTSATVYGRDGSAIGEMPQGADTGGWAWADDSRQMCDLALPSGSTLLAGPTTLYLIARTGAARRVAQVGTMVGQSAPHVAACSVLADRAVVVQAGPPGNASELWVLKLSTGKVVRHATYPTSGGGLVRVVASRDGQLLAETPFPDPKASGGQATTSAIVRASDGAHLGDVAGVVQGFSWSGDLAVVSDGVGSGVPRVVRWRSGQVVWAGPAGSNYRAFVAEPAGQRVAIGAVTLGSPTSAVEDIWIVSPDGRSVGPVRGRWP